MKNIYIILFISIISNSLISQGYNWDLWTVTENCGITIADVDISTTGTLVAQGDDVSSINSGIFAPVFLPFAFRMPGSGPSYLIVPSSNGYLSSFLADGGPDLSNDCPLPAIPSTPGSADFSRMYPLHDDLVAGGGAGNATGGVFAQALNVPHPTQPGDGHQSFVFYWNDANHFGAPGSFDYAVVLWSNHDFAYIYGPGNIEDGSGSTTGVQGPASENGTITPTRFREFVPCNTIGSGLGTSIESICVFTPMIIPTMTQWSLIILGLSFFIIGVVVITAYNRRVLAAG